MAGDKLAASHSKRQKIGNASCYFSSPTRRDNEESDVPPDGVPEDGERLTQEIQSKLDKLKFDHVKRNRASKEFEVRIKEEQRRLFQTIESAIDKIERRRDDFRSRMLPIFDVAMQDLSFRQKKPGTPSKVLTIESKFEPASLHKANKILTSCSELLACYKKAASILPTAPSTSRIQTTFETDKNETLRALESAKKMTINHLQAGLADKTEETIDRYDLDDDEYHLARKMLMRGDGSSPTKITASIGSLLYDFGKIVGKMQNLIDG